MRRWIIAALLQCLPTAAGAAQVCFDATAAEVTRFAEAQASIEAKLGRTITAAQFAKYASRDLVLQLIGASKSATEQAAAVTTTSTYMNAVKADMPDPMQ